MANEIESTLTLPYPVIEISTGDEYFKFQFDAFDDNQNDDSIRKFGVTGKFSIVYQCQGIDSHFECDVTVGNVHDFYLSLDNIYDLGQGTVAVLKNYGNTLNRTNLTITFDKKGHWFVKGNFKNSYNQFKSGVNFSLTVDPTDISEILFSLDTFLRELARIQGHRRFY